MMVGAVHGQGIYISAFYATASGYSRPAFGSWRGGAAYNTNSQGMKTALMSEKVKDSATALANENNACKVIVVIEMIKRPEYNKQGEGNILVVTDQKDIMIRYYLIENAH